jgi:hypothetical protein
MMVDKIAKTDSSSEPTIAKVVDTQEITVPAEVTYTITVDNHGTISIA